DGVHGCRVAHLALTVHSQLSKNGPVDGSGLITKTDLERVLRPISRGGPGYLAVAAAIRSSILDGRFPLRARLPSERDLAALLGVSRTTTTAAYDVLRRDGYLESRRGSGSRVVLPT